MLTRVNRLTKKTDFENIRQNGKYVSSRFFNASIFDRKDMLPSRFGFIVSKKISTKAHTRNSIKRLMREVVRKNLPQVKVGKDFVIIAKSGINHTLRDTIEVELKKILDRE